MSPLLSIAAAARACDVPRSSLRTWVANGEIRLADGQVPESELPKIRERAQWRRLNTGKPPVGNSEPVTGAPAPPELDATDDLVTRFKRGRDAVALARRIPELEPGLLHPAALHAMISGTGMLLEAWGEANPETPEEAEAGARAAQVAAILLRCSRELGEVLGERAADERVVEFEKQATDLEKQAEGLDGDAGARLRSAAAELRAAASAIPTTRGRRRAKET